MEEEESVVFLTIEVGDKHAGPTGGDGIYRTHPLWNVGVRGWRIHPPGNDRSKIHA